MNLDTLPIFIILSIHFVSIIGSVSVIRIMFKSYANSYDNLMTNLETCLRQILRQSCDIGTIQDTYSWREQYVQS